MLEPRPNAIQAKPLVQRTANSLYNKLRGEFKLELNITDQTKIPTL